MILDFYLLFTVSIQPLRLDVKRKLTARSDRVKSVDLHPTEPWMLASLYNGNVHVWNIDSQQLVKSFEVSTGGEAIVGVGVMLFYLMFLLMKAA